MDKKIDNFDMDEAFEDIFGDDTLDSDKAAVNDKGKKSTPPITSVKQVLNNGIWIFNHNLLLYTEKDKEKFSQSYNFIIDQKIPELNKAEKGIVIDDFSMLFVALCETYWQLYICILCGIKDIGENPYSLKPKLIQCLRKIVARDAELYTDREINYFFSSYSLNDAWHEKKLDAVKNFVKNFECEDENFSYILFYISSRFIDGRFNEFLRHKLYVVSLYCAYISNKHFIHDEANKCVISKLFKYKKQFQHSSKNLILALTYESLYFEHSFYDNIDTLLDVLDLEAFIMAAPGYHPDDDFEVLHSRQHPRTHFIKSEHCIIRLFKWCLGKPHSKYGRETSRHEQVIDDLYNVLQIPQNILRNYPAIVFLIYWSISYIKYNDFKSLFVEKTKPNAFSKTEGEKHPYIKHSEYDKFTRNKFIPINEDPAPVLQLLLYFGILDLVPNEIDLISEFDKAMHDSNWFVPKNQLELLNKLLDYKKLPIVTKEIDFCGFDGDGFSKTESAVNLIYNIISFNSTNPEMGIVQQVNHLDELRDRLFKYHNASWYDASDPEKDDYKKELYLLQSIDCGFEINNVCQTNLNHHGTGCSRDFTCKLFSKTDNSCVPTTKDYNLYRHQYRSMLSKLYIKIARNMFVHYAPYKPTLKLLEIRNFNDLLGILYDVKSRLEHESVLFSIAGKYEGFEFRPKGAFDVDGCKSSLVNVLKEAFSSIIENEDAYIKQVASEKKDWIDAFEPLRLRSEIEDPIFKPIHENIDKNIQSHEKSVEKITQESFDILKSKQHEFIQWITRLLDEGHTTPSLRDAITSLECLYYCYTYTFSAGRSEPWPDEIKKRFWDLQRKIEAWESYFEWLIVKQDMSCAKTSLEKLDYFENNFAETIDLSRLDFLAKEGDYTHFENEIQEISKKLSSYLIFKDVYRIRDDFGICKSWDDILQHDESLRYAWFHYDINAIIEKKDTQEMKMYLEFLEYEVLENEIYYPDAPQFKKDFLEFLKNIDSLIKAHFNDGELLSYAKHIGKIAQSKLENINKGIDVNSVNVFKDDDTYNIHLLEITKKLLMRVVCYITSMDDVEIRKKLMGKPLLDHNGNLTIKRSFLKEIKNELGEKKYENPLYDDLQAYLNFIFGVTGHYQYHNGRVCEKTIFDLYGERIFLYLVRVTFEMSQLEDSKKKAS